MTYPLIIHSFVRFLILLIAATAIIWFIVGIAQKRAYDKIARLLMSGFSGLLDLQMLLGSIYLLWDGFVTTGFPAYRFWHAGVMIMAVVTGHLPSLGKDQPDSIRYQNGLLAIFGSLTLIMLGMNILPGGWLI